MIQLGKPALILHLGNGYQLELRKRKNGMVDITTVVYKRKYKELVTRTFDKFELKPLLELLKETTK